MRHHCNVALSTLPPAIDIHCKTTRLRAIASAKVEHSFEGPIRSNAER